jgi:hypothetical protein
MVVERRGAIPWLIIHAMARDAQQVG